MGILVSNFIKTIIWSIFVPGTITTVLPYLLLSWRPGGFAAYPPFLRFIGSGMILLGVMIYIWCAWNFTFSGNGTPAPFDPPRRMVMKGPYRFVRNPMYLFVSLVLFGEAVFFNSAILLIYAVVHVVFLHLLVVYYEEPILKRRFGEPYDLYSKTVPRWIPRRRAAV